MSGSEEGDTIGFWEVTAIGIGGMVGGGIFAVLGLSVDLAKGGAPVAFLFAGIVALSRPIPTRDYRSAFPAREER